LNGIPKDAANTEKHGITFDDAKSVFADPQHLEEESTQSWPGERRRLAIGQLGGVIVTVIYTDRSGARRIISARRARRDERERYRKSAEAA
jgi:uncharacterized DUF497 family protein